MENPILNVVKYKLGVALTKTGELVVKTRCFFCGTNGEAREVSLNLAVVNSRHDLFPDFTRDGNGHALRVSAPVKYPFLYELAQRDGVWVSKRGVYTYVIESLIEHFNFTLTVSPSAGGGSGAPIGNGSWNGKPKFLFILM